MRRWLGVVPCLAGVAFPAWGQTPGWQASIAKVSVDAKLNRTPGTAFVVAIDGQTVFLVTCAHVVENESSPQVEFTAAAYKPFPATVRAREPGDNPRGLALLVVANAPPEVRALPLAAEANPVPGERVIVAGFPRPKGQFLAPETTIAGYEGLDLSLSRETPAGFSGGPVLRGDVAVGVVYGNEAGYGTALVSDSVRAYLRGLKVPLGGSVGVVPAASQAPQELRAGSTRVNPNDGLTYVWIPPGTFRMGCSPGDTECTDDEKPAHSVTISKGFWLGQTEVTQSAYQKLTGNNPSALKGNSLPVEKVSWTEASAYCKAAGGRLPTEAEWEYAARAGSTAARYGALDAIAWHSGNGQERTHEVGEKLKNGFALYDMLGNVWEWTADWYGYYTPNEATDPKGPASGSARLLRGGSWGFGPRVVRLSIRNKNAPSNRFSDFGFRCVGG